MPFQMGFFKQWEGPVGRLKGRLRILNSSLRFFLVEQYERKPRILIWLWYRKCLLHTYNIRIHHSLCVCMHTLLKKMHEKKQLEWLDVWQEHINVIIKNNLIGLLYQTVLRNIKEVTRYVFRTDHKPWIFTNRTNQKHFF